MSTTCQFFHHRAAFTLRSGEMLPEFTLAYETYGRLNAAKSNVVLLFHALSGSQHAAGVCEEVAGTDDRWTEDCQAGWWSDFIGPGKALDTNKWFVVCANFLGGCYGTTGPCSVNPATGKPYGAAFPHVSICDVVQSQVLLLEHLGVRNIHAVVGVSTGGLMAINFATLFPERVKVVIPLATGGRTTVLNRLIIFEQILAIENDPNFNGGDYYDGPPPTYGLALARMISHKTFVHLDEIEKRARGDVKQPEKNLRWYRLRDSVESYILHQGTKFVRRFDANTYLRICEMWSSFDPVTEAGAADWAALLAPCRRHGQHWLIFSIDSDFCFYPEEQAALVHHLREAEINVMHITVHSLKGHDSFLLEPLLYTPHLVYALEAPRLVSETGRDDPGM
ncbi:MAG TPA: homoserine O-acetyltransferase [Verrucomicrobiales bacterium]|jgi:homoserine O-acetyltransferase|nr:homoserine O-acetyltransferase [Verrucomicrobiales bacterium]